MGPDLLLLLFLLILNGLFSMSEIAVFSSKKVRLENLAKKGDASARQALKLSNDPTRFLSTVQVGITLISILTGAVSGASLAAWVAPVIERIEPLAPYSNSIAFFLAITLITYLSLIIGELVPKKLALHNPEAVARFIAGPMRVVSTIFSPLVWILSVSTEFIVKVFRLQANSEPSVTEEEIKSLITQGTTSGEFEEVEQDIIERVFNMGDRRVGSLMTHRSDLEWIDARDSFEVNRDRILQGDYSSFPLCDEEIDQVIGIVQTKKFLIRLHAGVPFDLRELAVKPPFVPENMTAFKVLELFKERMTQMAIVVDEFGTVQGIVTMHDLIEALLGEINTNNPEEEESILEREDGSWLIDAMLPFEEFLSYFDIDELDDDDRNGFHTLGGFILHLNEQIPRTGEIFVWRNFSFEIVDMDGNRIDKILVRQNQDIKEEE